MIKKFASHQLTFAEKNERRTYFVRHLFLFLSLQFYTCPLSQVPIKLTANDTVTYDSQYVLTITFSFLRKTSRKSLSDAKEAPGKNLGTVLVCDAGICNPLYM